MKLDIKAINVKCPHCSKDIRHGGCQLHGTNQRGNITARLMTAFKKKKTEHIFYRKRGSNFAKLMNDVKNKVLGFSDINKEKELYLHVPDPVEGHHLVTCEAVEGEDWYKLFYKYCYNINCPQNGVVLPGDMLVACHFEVPLHMGPHGATVGWDTKDFFIKKSYVESVQKTVKNMKKNKPVSECKKLTAKEIKQFHSDMLDKSNFIFKRVRSFNWLISSDGMHYHSTSNIGCYDDCRTLSQKRDLMDAEKKVDKGDGTADWFMNLTKAFVADNISGECKSKRGRNHESHGCKGKSEFSWTECRWDKKDVKIEKLKDDN